MEDCRHGHDDGGTGGKENREGFDMMTVEQRVGGAGALALAVTVLPLYGAGYGAFLVGKALAAWLRKGRLRRRCEKARERREGRRIALREARKQERRGENWVALRHAKGAPSFASAVPSSAEDGTSVLKNVDFENTGERREESHVPTGEEVARQWDRTHDSPGEMVRFGLMLLEVEGATDSSVIMGENEDGERVIVGRNPGVRGWLAENCPHIGYKTAMRYKSLARKALQAGKGAELVARGESAAALQESLYAELGIVRCPRGKPRARRKAAARAVRRAGQGRRVGARRGRDALQSLVFAMRARMRDALGALSAQEARRLGAAFLSLAGELCGAS